MKLNKKVTITNILIANIQLYMYTDRPEKNKDNSVHDYKIF